MKGVTRVARRKWLPALILFGLASLLADTCYEGFRSILGPLVAREGGTLLETGAAVALGELVNWGLRLPAGILADRLGAWWLLTILGYALTPVGVAAGLYGGLAGVYAGVVLERLGKTLRGPSRDALLSGLEAPPGLVYGLHELMDQVGAVAGPLLAYYSIASRQYWLLVAAGVASAACIASARLVYEGKPLERRRPRLRLYARLVAIGASTILIPHPVILASLAGGLGLQTPLYYAVIMGVDAAAALPLGRLYDAVGAASLTVGPLAGLASAALLVSGHPLAAAILAGVGVASIETVYRAYAASVARGEAGAFGALHLGVGLGQAASAVLYALLLG